ncbi:hypothetical protein [uncultured Microbacterium sp.]|nr:hypothetical protein [uncultured Microbacterium sp.]
MQAVYNRGITRIEGAPCGPHRLEIEISKIDRRGKLYFGRAVLLGLVQEVCNSDLAKQSWADATDADDVCGRAAFLDDHSLVRARNVSGSVIMTIARGGARSATIGGNRVGRTAEPNKELDKFKASVTDSFDRYSRVEAALVAAGEPENILRGAAEDAAFRLGVLWETFQQSWHLAAISKDPTRFRGHMQGELGKALSDQAVHLLGVFHPSALEVPTRPKMPQVLKSLDPQGFNITFADAKAWGASATKHLSATHAARVNAVVSAQEASSLVHLLKKLRNHLAHKSDGSKKELDRALRGRVAPARVGLVGTANVPLQRDKNGVGDLGKYLRVQPVAGGKRRIEILHDRISAVSEMLRI